MTIIVQWKPKLKLTIVTKSLNQLKVKMKVTLRSFEPKSIDFDIDFDVGSEHDFENLETMRLQHKQEIRTMDFGPNLHRQVSECADKNAIRSNNLTCFNCKSPDNPVKDCPEP